METIPGSQICDPNEISTLHGIIMNESGSPTKLIISLTDTKNRQMTIGQFSNPKRGKFFQPGPKIDSSRPQRDSDNDGSSFDDRKVWTSEPRASPRMNILNLGALVILNPGSGLTSEQGKDQRGVSESQG
jgi:hypothetical protein